MIREAHQVGVIISADVVRHEEAVRQIALLTGWPTLPDATTWLLRRELTRHVPRFSLFWLEHEDGLQATAELIGWLRETYPAVWRAVVAYQVDGDVEMTLRSSGAQLYLPTAGDVRGVLERSIMPLVHTELDREKWHPAKPHKGWSVRDGPPPPADVPGRFRAQRHPP